MSFEEWIELIEEEGTKVVGLRHCSLEHRTALKTAFEAGQQRPGCADEVDCLDFMNGG